jgi:hypothetical protein
MVTVEEIEAACNASQPLDFPRHDVDAPELNHGQMFYPYGFPTEVKTNAPEILTHYAEMWGAFEKRFDTDAIRVDVHVVEGESTGCPPTPKYRLMRPLMLAVADADNYSVADIAESRTRFIVSRATLQHKAYLRYFFLDGGAVIHLATRLATPIHAGCVALRGRGILLLGDSGAGKSSLSYACARTGWTYIADDLSFLLNGGSQRMVIGNCYQVRFRPTAAELFPEVKGLEITPRAAGKPSIEMPTAFFPQMICAQTTHVDFLVFLNRRAGEKPELVPYRKEVARYFMRQVLFGSSESLAAQYAALERLLTAEIFELRYSDLGWAVDRLEKLAREGR